MNERNFYLTGTRIVIVLITLLSLAAYWIMVISYIGLYNNITNIILCCIPMLFLTNVIIYFCCYWLQSYPFQDIDKEDDVMVSDMLCLINESMYDINGDSLGVCQGIYMSGNGIRVMIQGRLYDINDVYAYEEKK